MTGDHVAPHDAATAARKTFERRQMSPAKSPLPRHAVYSFYQYLHFNLQIWKRLSNACQYFTDCIMPPCHLLIGEMREVVRCEESINFAQCSAGKKHGIGFLNLRR